MPSPRLHVFIALGVCALTSPSIGSAEPSTDAATSPAAETAAVGSSGSWAHVDPQTGKLIPAPPTGRAMVPVVPAFSTSHQGLVEQVAPGGGVMIDLQGRFRSAATATVGADGAAHVDCVPPGTTDRKE
jgi:hypothetical protein